MYDNLKIPSTKIEAEEGEFLFFEDIMLHSKTEGNNQIPYNFVLNYSFDQDKNQVTVSLPDDQPNGARARFVAEASIFMEKTLGREKMKYDDKLLISGFIQNASITFDLGFYKQMGQKHI